MPVGVDVQVESLDAISEVDMVRLDQNSCSILQVYFRDVDSGHLNHCFDDVQLAKK